VQVFGPRRLAVVALVYAFAARLRDAEADHAVFARLSSSLTTT
jgi:hypothetical protein